MNTDELNIRLALNLIPKWNSENTKLIKVLADSITCTSYLLLRDKKEYVLRIDKPFTNGISPNRVNESVIRRALSKNNFSSKLIYSNPEKGLLLNEFLTGRAWTDKDIHSEVRLIRLAYKLKKLHNLEIEAEPFDLMGGIKAYVNDLGTQQAKNWGETASNFLAMCSQRPLSLCHNDLHAKNIIEGDELYFIDWEYAGLGNPLFDVATIFQHHQLTNEQREIFFQNYFDEINSVDRQDIYFYTQIYDLLLALWLSMLIKSTDLNPDQTQQSLIELETVKQRIDDNISKYITLMELHANQ